MAREYGYWLKADQFLESQDFAPRSEVYELTYEQLRELFALALARGHYGNRVASICDLNGTAWDKDGRHFDGAGQGSEFERY